MNRTIRWLRDGCLALVLWGTTSQARADIWTVPFTVLNVHSYTDGEIAVWGGSNIVLTDTRPVYEANACPLKSSEMRISPRADNGDRGRMLSMLMAAFLSGKKVQLYISTTECASEHPAYWGVRILSS